MTSSIEKRLLGKTGIEMTCMGFGCASVWGKNLMSDEQAQAIFEQAYELEVRDPTAQLPKIMQGALKLKGLHPSTSRNFAKGTLEFHDGQQVIKRSGDMIYEFVYMGTTVKEKMEN